MSPSLYLSVVVSTYLCLSPYLSIDLPLQLWIFLSIYTSTGILSMYWFPLFISIYWHPTSLFLFLSLSLKMYCRVGRVDRARLSFMIAHWNFLSSRVCGQDNKRLPVITLSVPKYPETMRYLSASCLGGSGDCLRDNCCFAFRRSRHSYGKHNDHHAISLDMASNKLYNHLFILFYLIIQYDMVW